MGPHDLAIVDAVVHRSFHLRQLCAHHTTRHSADTDAQWMLRMPVERTATAYHSHHYWWRLVWIRYRSPSLRERLLVPFGWMLGAWCGWVLRPTESPRRPIPRAGWPMDDVRGWGLCGEVVAIGCPPTWRRLPCCIVPSVHDRLRCHVQRLVVADNGTMLHF